MLRVIVAVEIAAITFLGAYAFHKRSIPQAAAQTVPLAARNDRAEIEPIVATASVKPKVAAQMPARKSAASPQNVPLPVLENPRLVIEKSSFRLTVYDGSRPVKTYPAAIGGGKGDKTREGDLCTPEGEFYVCVKNPHSQYVLALGLSYPDVSDAERGLRDGLISRGEYRAIVEAIQSGRQPPWKTALGGEIMIHGRRDDRQWTKGCIALDDSDIRELYRAIPGGSSVIIRP